MRDEEYKLSDAKRALISRLSTCSSDSATLEVTPFPGLTLHPFFPSIPNHNCDAPKTKGSFETRNGLLLHHDGTWKYWHFNAGCRKREQNFHKIHTQKKIIQVFTSKIKIPRSHFKIWKEVYIITEEQSFQGDP